MEPILMVLKQNLKLKRLKRDMDWNRNRNLDVQRNSHVLINLFNIMWHLAVYSQKKGMTDITWKAFSPLWVFLNSDVKVDNGYFSLWFVASRQLSRSCKIHFFVVQTQSILKWYLLLSSRFICDKFFLNQGTSMKLCCVDEYPHIAYRINRLPTIG